MKSVRGVLTICTVVLMAGFGVAACSSDSKDPVGVDGGGLPGTGGGGGTALPDAGGVDAPVDNVDCTTAKAGSVCSADGVCVAGVCATSRCGDGIVDPRVGEDCEDNNETAGDGCTQCRFDCSTSASCDDGNVCNGAETCNLTTRICEPGTAAGAVSCMVSAGVPGTCKEGVCAGAGCGNGKVDVGEDCDDKTAGCTKDCKFVCKVNADCDNKNACDGAETCEVASHTCKPGTAVVCKANNCTGMCDPGTGMCDYPDADKDGSRCNLDCNDADPAIFPGGFECKDGKDNDCNAATADSSAVGCECYVDSDKDGFAASVTGAIAAAGACPTGYTRTKPIDANTTDCAPSTTSAFPGQTQYFPTPYCTVKFCIVGQGSFDYNCNTTAESSFYDNKLAATTCTGAKDSFTCSFSSGWVAKEVPACGASGTYRSCSYGRTGCVGVDTPNRIRPCR